RKYFVPDDAPLAAISLLDSRVEHANGGLPDIAAGAVTLDERNNRVIGNTVPRVTVLNRSAFGRYRNAVIGTIHEWDLRHSWQETFIIKKKRLCTPKGASDTVLRARAGVDRNMTVSPGYVPQVSDSAIMN